MPETARRIVLARRPHGAPVPDDFRLEEGPVPEPREGEALVRTVWLSLDPYMRGRMSDAPSYAAPVDVGAVMERRGRRRGGGEPTRPRSGPATWCAASAAGRATSRFPPTS